MAHFSHNTPPREVLKRLKALGEHVRIASVRRGMGTQEFAQECGIGRRSFYRIETGEAGVALARS